MVMHARKLPRLSDGYFDRNQSHSFENTNKFSKPHERTNEKIQDSPVSSESSSKTDFLDNRSSPRYHRTQRLKDKDIQEDCSIKSPVKNESKINLNKDSHKSQASFDREGSSESFQSNHDQSASDEIERYPPISDWSEHISSSGKKYYYNCKTEISQWEKPKELIEWERQQNLSRLNYEANRLKDRGLERLSGAGNDSSNSKNSHSQETLENSSEASELDLCRNDSGSHNKNMTPCTHSSISTSTPSSNATNTQVTTHTLSLSQVTLSNLPKLISQLAGTKGLPNLSELSPQEALRTIQQALQLTKQVTTLTQNADSHQIKPAVSPAQSQNHLPVTTNNSQNGSDYLTNSTSTLPNVVENKPEIDRDRTSPGSDSSTHSVRHDSPTSSVSSLQSLNAAGTSSLPSTALKPSIPSLTPSLANYYREDLIKHVLGWQADHAEHQANHYWDEAHKIGSLNCTRVSAELKTARALVRLAEIKATLQEQRILFLRQQAKEIEDMKASNNNMDS